jgi:hypothetical protein
MIVIVMVVILFIHLFIILFIYFFFKDVCSIKKVPFRGVNCSDAAGSQNDFHVIVDLLLNNATQGRKWDTTARSPYFNYKVSGRNA